MAECGQKRYSEYINTAVILPLDHMVAGYPQHTPAQVAPGEVIKNNGCGRARNWTQDQLRKRQALTLARTRSCLGPC